MMTTAAAFGHAHHADTTATTIAAAPADRPQKEASVSPPHYRRWGYTLLFSGLCAGRVSTQDGVHVV